jgi:hypothetical protein
VEARPGSPIANEALKTSYETNLQKVNEELSRALRKVSQGGPDDAVQRIVDQARQMAFEFGTQRSRVQLFAPKLDEEVPRRTKTYTDVNNSNPYIVPKGIVQLIVAPGIRRIGGVRGYSLLEDVIVWPATVYLIPSQLQS